MPEASHPRTPGEMLREARERRGLNYEQLQERTKIPVRMLIALERDEYHKLSGPLYVKSFLRSFAVAVELDPDHIIAIYDQSTTGKVAEQDAAAAVWTEEEVAVTRVGVNYGPWLRRGAIGAVVLVVLVLGVSQLLRPRSPRSSSPATTPVTARPTATAAVADTLAASEVDTMAAKPPPPPLPYATAGREGMSLQDGKRWPLVLRIVMPGRRSCTVRSDGQTARQLAWSEEPPPLPVVGPAAGTLYATSNGPVAYWGAEDHFTVTLDNLSGVEVTLNGQLVSTSGWRAGRPVVLDRDTLGGGQP